jgi:hypothetical protein
MAWTIFLDVIDFNISRLEVIDLLNVSRLEIVHLFFLKLFLSLTMSIFHFQVGSMDLIDRWYQHFVPLFSCIHHVVESYRQLSFDYCVPKSSSTKNRWRFDDSYWCIKVLIERVFYCAMSVCYLVVYIFLSCASSY